MKAFLALTRIDLKLALRNRSVLFFNYFFPLIFFFMFGFMMNAEQGSRIIQVVSMVTAIGILGNGLFGAGMRAVQDRETDVLRRYKVTPITPVPLLAASMVTGVILYLPGLIIILILANRMFGMVIPPNIGSLFVFAIIACVAFRSMGLIIAAVVNSSQESLILIQPLYMAMLFLSGATIPLSLFPDWLQLVSQFIPATYLMIGVSGILQQGESVLQNMQSVIALIITALIGLFIATKLFRWEKEEKLRNSAKLWVLSALAPFLLLGIYQSYSRQDLAKAKILARDMERGKTWLIQNARVFVGNGKVLESASILIKGGKIAEIYEGNAPDPKTLKADPVEAAGKTVLPGLIDVHVHLGATGGFVEDWTKFDQKKAVERELRSYLYCGVTSVRSAGDPVDDTLKVRKLFGSGEKLGTELFMCGPLFTTEGGHGTEYGKFMPEGLRAGFLAQFVRTPKTAEEARKQVDALAAQKVDAIKGVLESGAPGYPFNRMDVNILRAVTEEAHAKGLPVAVHTGKAEDVVDAVSLPADSIEHGSFVDEISDATIAEMKAKEIAYDPTLCVVEGFTNFAKSDTSLLKRSLVQQVTRKELLDATERAATKPELNGMREGLKHYPMSLDVGGKNLIKAWHAGVMLVTGTDAGNFLVLHGPTVQHEVELWVAAGIPIDVALQAATLNAAKLLRADSRIGTIEKGKEATILIVDGNPLQDVRSLSAVSTVFMKGERVNRTALLQEK
ncbi:MAG TPA: amidohydrolase family protein [Chthoniobacterales bacterium]|jgi:imidazolonepropionase-like amidohydrolase/ABC-type multidrug transport system permease subunit|nr:amidohydrolase family protein [Chthoniobacterales bacterium]